MNNAEASPLRSDAVQHLEQAYILEENGEFEKALDECDAAIRKDPSFADAHNLRGVILEELNRKEEAIVAYQQAVRLDPSFQAAGENLHDLKTELTEDRLQSLDVEGKGFGVRTAAYVIDAFVFFVANYVAILFGGTAMVIVLSVILMLTGQELIIHEETLQCLNLISGLVLFTLYFTVFEWLYGATLGKLVLQMRVVKDDGEPCDFRASFTRGLYRFIDGLTFGIIALYHMKSSTLKQRLGDKVARTIVVGTKESLIQEPRSGWWFLLAGALYLTVALIITFITLGLAVR